MALNPNIAMGFQQPKFMTPADAMSLKQLSQQMEAGEIDLQEKRRAQQENMDIRQALSMPDSRDRQGGISTVGLDRIAQINPMTASKIQADQEKRRNEAYKATATQLGVTEKQNDLLAEALTGHVARYEATKSRLPPEQSMQEFRNGWQQYLQEVGPTGQFTPAQLARMRNVNTPEDALQWIGGSKAYKDFISTKKTEDTAPRMRTRIDGANEVQEQWNPQTRQWDKIGSGPRFARQVPAVVNVGGGAGGKAPAGYRWGPKDDNGEPTLVPIKGGPADKGTGSALTTDAIDLRASQYLAGDSRATANLGRGRQGAEDIIKITNRAAEMLREKGGNPQEIGRRIAEFRANSNSLSKLTQSYDAVTAFEETAIRNGERLKELAVKADTTGVPVIERWIRGGRKEIAGDVDVSKFMAQLTLYRAEAARILTNPNLAGVLTDSARKEVEEFLKPNASKDQIVGVVDLLKRDFHDRKETMEGQINAVRGRLERNLGPGQQGNQGNAPNAPTRKPLSSFGS